jgi:hypothetical protein
LTVSSPSIGFERGNEVKKTLQKTAWRQQFQQLEEYKRSHGDCKVTQQYSGNPQLGNWVMTQRQNKRKGILAVQRQDILDSIGFEWGKEEKETPLAAWSQRFQQLIEYKWSHGDCKVPQRYSSNPQLGNWVMAQRRNKQARTLGSERQAQLDSIGFEWGKEEKISPDTAWRQRFQQLIEYKQTHGDCIVPRQYSVNPQLGHWVNSQRQHKRSGKFDVERQAQLDSIGFEWGKEEHENPQAVWSRRFQELVEYKQTHGHSKVPHQYNSNPQLGNWVMTQRQKKRTGALGLERQAQLDSIGLEWGSRNC